MSAINNEKRLKDTWNQKKIPVALRRSGKGKGIKVRMPFANDNKFWLRNNRHRRPTWNAMDRCWDLPKAWFNDFVDRSLHRWGSLYVIQPYRELEICAPACMNAKGHDCQCSCMGANHGQGNDGSWFCISDAFAARLGDQNLACRLMKKK